MKKAWWVGMTALALGGGCGGSPPLSPVWSSDGLPDAARIFAEVKALRELPSKTPPRVRFLRRSELLGLMGQKREPDELGRHAKLFGLARGDVAFSTEQVRLATASGLYRQSDATIYVVDDPSRRFPALLEQVVAHEAVHALQDQNGLLPPEDERFTVDEELARRALLEGDATMTELAYGARDWHVPTRRLAERVRRGFAEEPIARFVESSTPELVDAPPYQRESVLFPYRAGSAFVATLLTTGGYALLARAYEAPPRATSHILHPERYARGEAPVLLPALEPPAGFEVGDDFTAGELLTRAMLLRCSVEERAIEAAAGWRGDRLVTLRSGSHEIVAQQWVTDSDTDAHELAAALQTTCEEKPHGASFVLERNARVVSVRGANDATARALATSWLNAPLTLPAVSKPLGELALAPAPSTRRTKLAFVEQGWLRLPIAGIELPVPDGFEVTTLTSDSARLRGPEGASIELHFMLGEYFAGAAEQLVRTVSRSMELDIAYSNVVKVGNVEALPLRYGTATVQTFGHGGTNAKARAVAVSLCGGAGLLTVIEYAGRTRRKFEEAIAALRALDGSTVCAELKP